MGGGASGPARRRRRGGRALIDPGKVDRAVTRTAAQRDIAGVVLRVDDLADGATHTAAAGDLAADVPCYLASTTKLHTLVLVARLADRGALAFDDRLVEHADPALVAGLHVHRGVDHTATLTLRHLLSQTSGLADYFDGRRRGAPSLWRQLRSTGDRGWTVTDAVAIARRIGPHFAPGTPGRARYSDTNYQLLGHVIERVTATSYADAVRTEIAGPLALTDTRVQTVDAAPPPVPLRLRGRPLHIPRAMASTGADGGVISTADDLATFLRALVERRLTPRPLLDPGQPFERIFTPLRYGLGIMRFAVPRWLAPGRRPPVLVGHSGISGAFAFHAPDRGVLLTGTVNELARPSRPFRMMLAALG